MPVCGSRVPLISVVTPTQAHNADHIGVVWTSLAAQALPAAWELEWLVQEDGAEPGVADLLPPDPRIRYDALGVQVGSPRTRNHALARARGEVVAGMDHDDWYEPGGLEALLAPLVSHPAELVAHGGWPAVVRSTDAILLAAFGDVHDGWWVDRAVAAYRRWPAQKTVQPQEWAIRDLPHVRGIIAQRRLAADALGQA